MLNTALDGTKARHAFELLLSSGRWPIAPEPGTVKRQQVHFFGRRMAMTEYLSSTYGDRIADLYDSLYTTFDASAVDLLATLAGDGPALELGIGTGRLALPLAERGIRVHGVDASAAMVRKLREKPRGAEMPVTLQDFVDFQIQERFTLVYVAFNTFFGLLTQEAQVRCFETVASHLRHDGVFVIEAFVPDLARFDRGQRVAVHQLSLDSLSLEATRHDPVRQLIDSQLVRVTNGGIKLFPVQLRYAWPSELDLMARLAGLELRNRWGGWERQGFGPGSMTHVSVYAGGDPATGA